MPLFDVQLQQQKLAVEAVDKAALDAAVTAEAQAAMPTWTVARVDSRDSPPQDGEWVVARRPDGTEEYAIVGTNPTTQQRGVKFADGLTRGLTAVVRRAP